MDSATGKVYFVGTDGKVYNYYWEDDHDWEIQPLKWNQGASIDPSGGLKIDAGKIYCVGTDKKVYNFYYQGGAWQFNALVGTQSVPIVALGGMTFDQTGKVFVIGTNGKVYNYYWTGSAWAFVALNQNQYTKIDPNGKLLVHSGKVYAIGIDGKVYNYYWAAGAWQFQWLVSNPFALADPAGGLKADAGGKVFIIGRDGGVYNYYWAGTSWAFNKLSPQQHDVARATNQLAVGDDTVYYANKAGFLEVFYYSDSNINYNDWDLIYDESFPNTTTIADLQTYWDFQFPWGPTISSSILAGYQWEYNVPGALTISGGNLYITADDQPIWAKLIDWLPATDILSDGQSNYRELKFTSGAMTTKIAYIYGLFEINCRLPGGKGFWPAFWLTGANSWPPEIDVFEFDGSARSRCSNNIHWRINPNETDSCGMEYFVDQDLTQAYHKFSMAWFPDRVVMYLDGRELRTIDHHVPQVPMRVIVNLAMGVSYPDSNTPFPSSFNVDYLRFYTHK